MSFKGFLSAVIATGLLIMSVATAKTAPRAKDKIAMAQQVKLELSQAITKAVGKVPGKAIEVELAKKKDKVVWEVEVLTAEGKLMEVDIDVVSGDVLDSEAKK